MRRRKRRDDWPTPAMVIDAVERTLRGDTILLVDPTPEQKVRVALKMIALWKSGR